MDRHARAFINYCRRSGDRVDVEWTVPGVLARKPYGIASLHVTGTRQPTLRNPTQCVRVSTPAIGPGQSRERNMGDTFSHAQVWHSRLKGKSPLVIRFKGEPFQSKYKDGGTIIYFEVKGDPKSDYYYRIEQSDILKQLENTPKNTWLKVSAFGGEGDQSLVIENVSGGEAMSAASNGSTGAEESFSTGYVVGDFVRCLEEAKGLCIGFTDDPDVIQRVAATLYINWSHSRFLRPLSKDDVPERTYENTDRSEEYRDLIREGIEKLPKTSGISHDRHKLAKMIAQLNAVVEGDDTISDEQYGRIQRWLDLELEAQSPEQEEAPEDEPQDDLPF